MSKVCILIFMAILLSGTPLSNKAGGIPIKVEVVEEIKEDSIKVNLVADRVQEIDSLFSELEKRSNDKKSR